MDKPSPIPAGYTAVTPLLLVEDCRGLLGFMKAAFDAVEHQVSYMPDGSIYHGDVTIGGAHVIFSPAGGHFPPTNSIVRLYVPDATSTYQRALAAGATSLMEPAVQFYGDLSAGVRDAFGISWWISTHVEDVPPDELKRREAVAMRANQRT